MLKYWCAAVTKKANPGRLRHLAITFSLLFCSLVINAQQVDEKVQMADGMRSNGKIYVVVLVLLTVLTGLILYVVKIDKKITRLENERKDNLDL